jgi:hypothetical protein
MSFFTTNLAFMKVFLLLASMLITASPCLQAAPPKKDPIDIAMDSFSFVCALRRNAFFREPGAEVLDGLLYPNFNVDRSFGDSAGAVDLFNQSKAIDDFLDHGYLPDGIGD